MYCNNQQQATPYHWRQSTHSKQLPLPPCNNLVAMVTAFCAITLHTTVLCQKQVADDTVDIASARAQLPRSRRLSSYCPLIVSHTPCCTYLWHLVQLLRGIWRSTQPSLSLLAVVLTQPKHVRLKRPTPAMHSNHRYVGTWAVPQL